MVRHVALVRSPEDPNCYCVGSHGQSLLERSLTGLSLVMEDDTASPRAEVCPIVLLHTLSLATESPRPLLVGLCLCVVAAPAFSHPWPPPPTRARLLRGYRAGGAFWRRSLT